MCSLCLAVLENLTKMVTGTDYFKTIALIQKEFESADREVDLIVFVRHGDGEKINKTYLDAFEKRT